MTNGEGFRQTFTRIKGLSTIRRLPRINKIRLGIKKISQKTGKEYPVETDYFVCPSEVMHFYGENPKELHIMFPLNDPESLFPQAYKWYGSSAGLKCKGDGITALRLNEETGEMEERECPCDLLEQGKCNQRASLVFMLPDVRISGVYQIDLSSYHSIVDINSGLDYALSLLGGRIAMVPFILKRVPRETHNEGKKQIHYTLQLELDINLKEARRIREGENVFAWQNKRYEIEPPAQDINPALEKKEDGAVIEEDDEPIAEIPDPAKVAKDDEILTKIYDLGIKKQLKDWEGIITFAYRTNILSAEEPMTVEQAKETLILEEETREDLMKKMSLIKARGMLDKQEVKA